MNGNAHLLLVMATMALATFAIRATPFLLLGRRADHPLLAFLGRYTPPAIMTILVIYSFGSVEFASPPHGAPELLASLLTLIAHLLWRQALVSIFAGTAFYMYALQSGLF